MKKIIPLLFALLTITLPGCDIKNECINGETQQGDTLCGENKYYTQICTSGTWVNNPNSCQEYCVEGSTCTTGPWIDDKSCTCGYVLEEYGLGMNQTEYVTAPSRTYDWYMDQAGTGIHSKSNCGPTSATMAIKWADGTFDKTPEDARKLINPQGGWWLTSDITKYLGLNNIQYRLFTVNADEEAIKQELREGKILIFCINASKLTYNTNNIQHVDNFYKNVTGHFIVAKGYTIVDGVLYIEVYDPNSLKRKYPNSSQLKGKNRYLKWDTQLAKAIGVWWNYAIAVYPVSSGMNFGVNNNAVNEDDIVHMPGGASVEK